MTEESEFGRKEKRRSLEGTTFFEENN